MVIGKKRTAKEAEMKGVPITVEDDTIMLQHVRDYAFTEQRGGTKGEPADYILQEGTAKDGKGELRYIPITSKIKLNKKRKAVAQNSTGADKVDNIILCPRSLCTDEAIEMKRALERHGTRSYAVDRSMCEFGRMSDIKLMEEKIKPVLMSLFQSDILQNEDNEDGDADGDGDGEAAAAGSNKEEDDIY